MIECNNIPKDHTEIPSPEVAMSYDHHLKHIAHELRCVHQTIEIELLIGRDLLSEHVWPGHWTSEHSICPETSFRLGNNW